MKEIKEIIIVPEVQERLKIEVLNQKAIKAKLKLVEDNILTILTTILYQNGESDIKKWTLSPDLKKIVKKPEKRPEKRPEKQEAKIPKAEKKSIPTQAYKVLKGPQVTERASGLTAQNQYVFKVWPKANKVQVKKAVEEVFGVDVLGVRIINVPQKRRRLGRTQGFRPGYKKAVVKIKEGQKIEVLPR